MKKLIALFAVMALGATVSFAQINNASASGTVSVNVAQNATVVFSGYSFTHPTYPLANSGAPTAWSGTAPTMWLVNGTPKAIDNPAPAVGASGALYYTIHGERGSNIKIIVSSSSSNVLVATWGATWDCSNDGTSWAGLVSGNVYPITYAGSSTLGTPGTNGYIMVRMGGTITPVATGSCTINSSVTISNYSI